MAKGNKASPQKQVYFKRAEDEGSKPCCGKPSTATKDIQKPEYPHLNQNTKGVRKNGKDNSKRITE